MLQIGKFLGVGGCGWVWVWMRVKCMSHTHTLTHSHPPLPSHTHTPRPPPHTYTLKQFQCFNEMSDSEDDIHVSRLYTIPIIQDEYFLIQHLKLTWIIYLIKHNLHSIRINCKNSDRMILITRNYITLKLKTWMTWKFYRNRLNIYQLLDLDHITITKNFLRKSMR
jgi:hypothetical protein